MKKGAFWSTNPVADVAHGIRSDATRHARPRGRAARAHVRRRLRTGRGHMAGGHAGPRGRPCGAPRDRGVGICRAH